MKTEDGQTLCDTNGVKLFPGDVYDEMYLPSSGLIRCSKDDSYGFVDEKKNEIVKFIYNDAFDFFGNIALVQKKDKWMFIDKKGKTVLAVKCNEAEKLGKGYYVLSSDSISSLYNSKAEKLLSFVTKKTNSSGAAILIEKPEIEFYNNSILSIDFNNKKAFYSLTRKSYIWKEEGFTE